MDFEKLTSQLAAQQAKAKPATKAGKVGLVTTPIEDRIIQLGKAKASMVAIWTVDEKGQVEYTCHRENFPVAELQGTAEQFSRDQFQEYVRALGREGAEQMVQAMEAKD